MRGAARDPAIYHPGPVFHHLGRQRRQCKSKTPKTLLNQAPPTVAGLFSCPGAVPAPGLFLVPPGGAGPPGMIPAADRDRPGGSWRQNDRPPGRGRRSKFCGGQIFPAVKILSDQESNFSSMTSSTMTSAYFSSSCSGVTSSPRGFPGVRVTSCLSVYPKWFFPRKMPDTGLTLPLSI